ncbi:PqqD family protein [Corynebacterium amycolatum]|uniref:PqqD family protein n=1 Tax=Corynebacterium amycolatum TaxID=43765 RepID=UPI0039BEB96A
MVRSKFSLRRCRKNTADDFGNSRIRLRDGVCIRHVDDKVVLIDLGTGETQLLNGVAADFVECCENVVSLNRVYTALLEKYDVPGKILREDLIEFSKILVRKGYLVIES